MTYYPNEGTCRYASMEVVVHVLHHNGAACDHNAFEDVFLLKLSTNHSTDVSRRRSSSNNSISSTKGNNNCSNCNKNNNNFIHAVGKLATRHLPCLPANNITRLLSPTSNIHSKREVMRKGIAETMARMEKLERCLKEKQMMMMTKMLLMMCFWMKETITITKTTTTTFLRCNREATVGTS